MKKNLKGCIEQIEIGDSELLLDMNSMAVIEGAGLTPDLRHNKSAHMTAAWRFDHTCRVCFPLTAGTLADYRYLTFSVFAVSGAGGSFSLMFDSSASGEGKDGYEITLPLTRDGWNSYRVELPFMRAVGNPTGWERVASLCFDSVAGGQANRTETVVYIDSLFVWDGIAPPLYASMPELKGAAVFSKGGNFAIVDRRRVCNTADGAEAKPFEKNGTLWLPMAPVAAGIAHSAVVDNRACTLSFTYRRKKYFFSADSDRMTVGEETQPMGFFPVAVGGTLFFPADFVRTFFHWRQIFTDPMGLVVLSNRKNVFESRRDGALIWQLVADTTFLRPDAERMLNDLHRRFPNPGRGRLLATFDQLMQLRKNAKSDGALKDYVERFKTQYGAKTETFAATPLDGEINAAALSASADSIWGFALLYRVTGDKQYAERTALECEALSALSDWSAGGLAEVMGTVSLAMAVGYDWCHHVWSEGRKALLERAMLRNGMRPGVQAYDGKLRMWHGGGVSGAVVNCGMLALALALADIYPQTSLKLLDRILRNAESCFAPYAPDGGYPESVKAWEKSCRGLSLMIAMLETACGTDYGLSSAPGFLATAYFPFFTESGAGAWNYHGCSSSPVDTALSFRFSAQTQDPIPAWMRRQQILSGKKRVDPLDILFYLPVDDTMAPHLPLDAVYRKAGLAAMRGGWDSEAAFLGLHGGKNHEINGALDAGSVILDMGGERFFVIPERQELPGLMSRRGAGQNTVVVEPAPEPAPDQNPDGVAPLTEMRSSAARAYAVVDMTTVGDAVLRGKRGAMLTENRSVAIVQDELTLTHPAEVVWTVWTRAEVKLNPGGRLAKLTQNGKTLVCKLAGVGSPARFEATPLENTDLTALTVRVTGKEKLRMAVVCRLLADGVSPSQKVYDVVPMSRWGEEA